MYMEMSNSDLVNTVAAKRIRKTEEMGDYGIEFLGIGLYNFESKEARDKVFEKIKDEIDYCCFEFLK